MEQYIKEIQSRTSNLKRRTDEIHAKDIERKKKDIEVHGGKKKDIEVHGGKKKDRRNTREGLWEIEGQMMMMGRLENLFIYLIFILNFQ
jgi:hypothetical protein